MARIFILLATLFLAFHATAKDYPDTDCAKDEKICLRVLRKISERSGDELKLFFENGQKTVIKTINSGCIDGAVNCELYNIIGIRHGYIQVTTAYYEGGFETLYRIKDGSFLKLPGGFSPSPSGKRFFSQAAAFGYGPSKIYHFINGEAVEDYSFPEDIEMMTYPVWKNENEIVVDCTGGKLVSIIFKKGSWSKMGTCNIQ
jgi:hypothetical protein